VIPGPVLRPRPATLVSLLSVSLPLPSNPTMSRPTPPRPIKKLMVPNRGEIAIRIFRTATELGIRTVALYTPGDDSHCEFADERILLDVEKYGGRMGEAFLDVEAVVKIAKECVGHSVDRASISGSDRSLSISRVDLGL